MNRNQTKQMILASFFIALGIILPYITGNIAILGNRFLRMEIRISCRIDHTAFKSCTGWHASIISNRSCDVSRTGCLRILHRLIL